MNLEQIKIDLSLFEELKDLNLGDPYVIILGNVEKYLEKKNITEMEVRFDKYTFEVSEEYMENFYKELFECCHKVKPNLKIEKDLVTPLYEKIRVSLK